MPLSTIKQNLIYLLLEIKKKNGINNSGFPNDLKIHAKIILKDLGHNKVLLARKRKFRPT